MTRKSQFSEEEIKTMVRMYKEGKSTVEIGKEFEKNPSTIAYRVKKEIGSLRSNRENSRKYSYNKKYFEEIDTKEKAYWLGFIYADGYIAINKGNAKRFGIALSEKDEEHLHAFNRAIDSNYEVKKYSPSKGSYSTNKYCRIQIFGREIFNNLLKHGVLPNKTDTLKEPNINPSFYPDFIRGYLDGDGSITSYKGDYSVKILGTKSILDFIKEFIESHGVAKIRRYYKRMSHQSVSSLELAGNFQVEKFLDLIYKDSTIHLDRKYKRYLSLKKLLHSRYGERSS